MRQSVLRIVFALLITAVGASLLIGSVSAEGPVPQQPPGSTVVVPEPTGPEIEIISGIVTSVEILEEVESEFQVTTEEDAEYFGATLMSYVKIVCKTPKHTFTYDKFKLEAIVRFCYNVTHPPNKITSYDRFEAISTASWPRVIVSDPWHRKNGGGVGEDDVKTKAKGQSCTLVLQETDDDSIVFECEMIYNLYINMKHSVGGESTGKGSVTSQDA